MIAILHAIERHTSALEARPDRRSEESWLTRYRRHLTEHHGLIDPPDFDRRRRVPIADLYVPPTNVPIAETDPSEIDLWTLDEEIDRTVLLGDPGAGKTTTANVLIHHRAQGTKVPFLVTLREYAAQDPPEFSVAAFIEHKLDRFYQCLAPPGLIARLLLSGRALVIFDGLDELVDTARRADVTAVIERFCTEYPLTRVLVTSGEADPYVVRLYNLASTSEPRLDTTAYLSAAACLLISAEAVDKDRLQNMDPRRLGRMSDLWPYMRRRCGLESDDELPELPVPERFQRLFRDWADNKVDFVGQAQESSEGGAV